MYVTLLFLKGKLYCQSWCGWIYECTKDYEVFLAWKLEYGVQKLPAQNGFCLCSYFDKPTFTQLETNLSDNIADLLQIGFAAFGQSFSELGALCVIIVKLSNE